MIEQFWQKGAISMEWRVFRLRFISQARGAILRRHLIRVFLQLFQQSCISKTRMNADRMPAMFTIFHQVEQRTDPLDQVWDIVSEKVKGIHPGLGNVVDTGEQETRKCEIFFLPIKRRAIPPRATVSRKGKWSIVIHAWRTFSRVKTDVEGSAGVEAIDWRIEGNREIRSMLCYRITRVFPFGN